MGAMCDQVHSGINVNGLCAIFSGLFFIEISIYQSSLFFFVNSQDCKKSETRDLEQLKAKINECATLLKHNSNIFYRCEYIVSNIDEPWSHETLKLIFNELKDAPKTISDEQLYKGSLNSQHISQNVFPLTCLKIICCNHLQKLNSLHRNEDA